MALAGCVIASHYAEPAARTVAMPVVLCAGPKDDAAVIRSLDAGEPFDLLDDSLGWAWGYAGSERRVGYIRSDALAAP